MNYLEQINVFWLLDIEHSFNGNETRLYLYLLKQSNSLYWKNPLTNADGHTAAMVGISVNTLKTTRNKLKQAGLIEFKTGGKGRLDKCVYEIIAADMVRGKVSKNDTLQDGRYQNLTPDPYPNQQPNAYPNQQKTDDIYKLKHKPKQKQNIYSAPEGAAHTEKISFSTTPLFEERKKSGAKKKKNS